jgi:hypothetical protein
MYGLLFDEEAIDFLEKLEARVRGRIFGKVLSTKSQPHRFFRSGGLTIV